jgi:ABC-2 type transport system ATP-binding protein
MNSLGDVVIKMTDLTKIYPSGVKAVDQLNLTVHRGEVFGLLGRNGAGKTTTAGMLTTRVVPTSGVAEVGEVDVHRYPAKARRFIGVVSQTNTLDRSLSVRENLLFQGRYFGMRATQARNRADELLERFELADRADAPIPALSGGLSQRLMLARSIMHKPPVLFLDEPTVGLDPLSRLAFWKTLVEMNDGGQTIFLTTHYMEEADRLCGRLAIIDAGRLLALGTPTDLKRSTGVDTTVTLAVEGDPATMTMLLEHEITNATSVHVVDGNICLGVKDADGILPRIVHVAERSGIKIKDLSIREPSLETVFIDLVGKSIGE